MSNSVESRIDILLSSRKSSTCLRIGIAGGSGSGKSTVCDLILQGLRPCIPYVISLDSFFKPVDQLPKYYSNYHHNFQPDFNTPDSLMVERMVAHCKEVASPGVVIFDGHFALYYPEMRQLMDIKCFIDCDITEMLKRRTERNLANDYGGGAEEIFHYNQECVVPEYYRYILPTRTNADIVIPNDTASIAERDAIIYALCVRVLTLIGVSK
jgi:uridine kinase